MAEIKHRGIDPVAMMRGEELGLSFDGMMSGRYQFTVARGEKKAIGITFYVKDLSKVKSRLAEKLVEFGIKEEL